MNGSRFWTWVVSIVALVSLGAAVVALAMVLQLKSDLERSQADLARAEKKAHGQSNRQP